MSLIGLAIRRVRSPALQPWPVCAQRHIL